MSAWHNIYKPEAVARSLILFFTALLWDLHKDEFDVHGLRKGICAYVDMTGWSMRKMSWRLAKFLKAVLIAFPFQLVDIYIAHATTLVYMIRKLAAKIFVPHTIEKFRILKTPQDYLDKFGVKETTPKFVGGTSTETAMSFLQRRGYLAVVKQKEAEGKEQLKKDFDEKDENGDGIFCD